MLSQPWSPVPIPAVSLRMPCSITGFILTGVRLSNHYPTVFSLKEGVIGGNGNPVAAPTDAPYSLGGSFVTFGIPQQMSHAGSSTEDPPATLPPAAIPQQMNLEK